MTFSEKIQRFIDINEYHVARVHTINEWFSLNDSIVFDSDAINMLVIPDGLHLEFDNVDDFPEQIHYILVDDDSGEYDEIIEENIFWSCYFYELEVVKALEE